jgi:TRAP-type C4-dicarboxylate transport system substrate-binding protein
VAGHDDTEVASPYARQIGAKGLISAVTLVTFVGGGCVDDGSSTKAGGEAAPVTLSIGTSDQRGTVASDQVEEFARQVEELSGGEIRVRPVWDLAVGSDWDQRVARLVVSGELDLGLIPARAWDTEGVSTLRPLHAPFLVTTDELLDDVVADEVAEGMLAGLDDVGVAGLALLPEHVRHVFSYGAPLLTPDDFAGVAIRAPTSETSYAVFEALGAVPSDFDGIGAGDLAWAIGDGTVDAMDSGFGAYIAEIPRSATAGNVVLYPKANTLVINAEVLAGLTEDQQAVLRRAATATREWAIANNPSDAERAALYCDDGGTIVTASESDLETLREAVQPVVDALAGDERTASIVDRLRRLADQTGPAPPIAQCRPTAVTTRPAVPTATTAEQEFPDGVYRAEITVQDLIAAGVDREDAFNHAATWTLTFADGRAIIHDTTHGGNWTCHGRYDVADGRVSLVLGDDAACGDAVGDVLFSAGWDAKGDELQFTDVRSGSGYDLLVETLFGGAPFTRID